MLPFLLVPLAFPAALAAADPAPDVQTIVKTAISREVGNQRKLADYTWQQKSVVRMLGSSASDIVKNETKVFEHIHIDGTSYRKLVEKDGKPLSEANARKEQEKMDKEIAKRRNESPAQRKKRLDEHNKEVEESIKFREEVMRAFDFRMDGEESINGFPAWRITGVPRADFKPKSRDGKMLAKIRGKMWVHKTSGEWLKFEMETLEKLTFGAFLASVAPGATISAQQMRVSEELWHPEWMKVRLNARALWKKMHADVETSYHNFRKFQVESKLVAAGEETEKPN